MKKIAYFVIVTLVVFFVVTGSAKAATDCTFNDDPIGKVMTLTASCTTDATIYIPDGYLLDGKGYEIWAIDPPPTGHFVGAVVQNAGAEAHVRNLYITSSNLKNVCDGGDNRLRGIMFNGASGSITASRIIGINQGYSGCQEGNGIEIRNAPFDGTHPNTMFVEISHNTVEDYQKTGIVANGDVKVAITNNYVGSANLPKNIAANSIQVGFGGSGAVNNNIIFGNQWDVVTTPQWSATAVLVYSAGDVNVNHNQIQGAGTDIGVAAYYSKTVNVMNNKIYRTPPTLDDATDEYGVGVDFYENEGKSKVVRNEFSGWKIPHYGAGLAKRNVVIEP